MSSASRPTGLGTLILLASLVVAYTALGGSAETAQSSSQFIAFAVATGICGSLLCDLRFGFRNLIRTDVVCIGALYVLTLVELLFPQPSFMELVSLPHLDAALELVILGFAGIAIGRHAPVPGVQIISAPHDISGKDLAIIGITLTLLGSLHMLVATNCNPVRIFEGLTGPRFDVPWARSRFGGWRELLNELSLLFYLVPPITAVATIRRREISRGLLILLWLSCLLVLFKGFAGGTRNVFLINFFSLIGAYLLFTPRITIKKVALVGAASLIISSAATYHMLEFRRMGLRNYIKKELYVAEETRDNLSIDNNVASLSRVVSAFPEYYDHLGWELPIWAIVKPIPRAIWRSKPKGLSVSIEEAVGGNAGYTVSTTYLGEIYIAFGTIGVVLFSTMLGAVAAAWDSAAGSSRLSVGTAIYASGFFAAAITTRSVLWFTTAILPSAALLIAYKQFLEPHHRPAKWRRLPKAEASRSRVPSPTARIS